MDPEALARAKIDALLTAAGWVVQERKTANLAAGRGVAIGELSFTTGEPDYTLFVDGKAIGTVEAKPEGYPLAGVSEQSSKYIVGLPSELPAWRTPLPFSYESTGTETRFTNHLDPEPRSREVFSFHRPETLLEWAQAEKQLNQRLRELPRLITKGLWPAQVQAIINLERSFALNKPRALIQMATGSGKTFTAVTFSYRLVKFAKARRVLFLVDRGNLGDQTLKEFQNFRTPDDGRRFTELYNVQHLTSNALDRVANVTIATIQRLYSMLRGEAEPAPDLDDLPIEAAESLYKAPVPVSYNPALPIETFDFIITDECHRSIYNLWRQVLEYFDAYIIGLTATPSKQTFGFFRQNLVMEYGHEHAVADGVNVGYDAYRIRTNITEQGSTVEAGFYVDKRDRLTRRKRWELLDDAFAYQAAQLDREVVAEDQIRTVLTAFRDALFTEIFPGRTEVPKTLIFAKDDSHADDIVRICREVFDKGNDFCQKITYRTTGVKPADLIASFRNSYNPRIAVTVDMIATGTDIKPLEIVLFMRSVQSQGFFEQMKGRGVRVIEETALQAVTPDARRKTHFIIVDAVGVCERDKGDSRPLERRRHVPFNKLLEAVALGNREPEALESLAGRLLRLERLLDERSTRELKKLTDGPTLSSIATGILEGLDPDNVDAASRRVLQDAAAASAAAELRYFDPSEPIANLCGDLPHWRQEGVTYFVTFRLADSLPAEKLESWRGERDAWLGTHLEPHDEATRAEYYRLFPERLQRWLDAGSGLCILQQHAIRAIVEGALRHFDGDRYNLDEFVVMPNHVHVLVTPLGEHTLSDILHSWKSFTAHEILKVEEVAAKVAAASRRGLTADDSPHLWQKESFDHIVRSPQQLKRIRQYIRDNPKALSGYDQYLTLEPTEKQRRDAAATLSDDAVRILATRPQLRNWLIEFQRTSEQTIDTVSKDAVIEAGFSAAALDAARGLVRSWEQFVAEHRDEITAIQLLYTDAKRLRYEQLKELAEAIERPPRRWTTDALWQAYERLGKTSSAPQPTAAGRKRILADLVCLVRAALHEQDTLVPRTDAVNACFDAWLAEQATRGRAFTAEQRAWLGLIRDHVATSLAIAPADFELSPFAQAGGLGRAHQLFGPELPKLLNELNEVLAA